MTEILINEVTSGTIEGVGAFDEIMKAAQVRLNHEYEKDRIKGTEYSKVYLGSMDQAMQQAIAFVLGRQQASAQADLIIKQGELVAIELLNAIKNGELIDQQILNLAAQLPQIEAQTANIEQDTELKVQQEKNLVKEIEKTTQEILVLEQKVLSAIEEVKLITSQVEKIEQEIKVMTWQAYSAEAQISDTYSDANIVVSGLMGKQIDKMKHEGGLLEAKKFTEQAQIKDTVDGNGVEGMIATQKGLYTAQTDGFSRDAEQKLAKIMSDSFAVRRSTDEAAVPPTNMDNDAIDAVILKAGQGIGVDL